MKEKFFDFGNVNIGFEYIFLLFIKVKYFLFENGKLLYVKYKVCFKDEGLIIFICGVEIRDCFCN